jgi:ubiquitin conjugation factor E4 B
MSFFNFTLKGDDTDETPSEEAPAPVASTLSNSPSASKPLTMEEIRAKRMNKYAKKGDSSAADTSADNAETGSDANLKDEAVSSVPIANTDNVLNKESSNDNEKSDNNLKTTTTVNVVEQSKESPEKPKSVFQLPSAGTNVVPTTPSNTTTTNKSNNNDNSNSNSNNSSTTSLTSPTRGNTPSRSMHALNNALESVFLFSLNKEHTVTTDGMPIAFVGNDDNGDSREKRMITRSNLTELVMAMLESSATPSCVNYLVATYKRILIKETTVHKDIKDEFMDCKTECISFLATCLSEPSTFSGSDTSLKDLMLILMDDNTPQFIKLLHDLSVELCDQDAHEDVTLSIVDACYTALNVNNAQATMNPMMMMQMMNQPPIYSILENVQGPIAVIQKICNSDKRIAQLVAKHAQFLVDPAVLTAMPSNTAPQMNIFANFGVPPPATGPSVVQGAAVADMTLLGRMMRYTPDIRDEQLRNVFGEIHRSSQSQVEGNINMIRGRINTNQQSCYSILMTLLQAKGEAKDNALNFLQQCIIGNAENEKDQPSPKIAASRGFMLNLSGVLLRLSKPIFADQQKVMLKKIDWQYLIRKESEKIFPRDATGLMTNAVKLPSADRIDETKNASFLTLCLFMCCRSLHLCMAPMCREYERIMMHLSRQGEHIQNGEPRALQILLHKLISEAELLNPELLEGVVSYCTSMAFVLMTALRNAGDEASNAQADEFSFLEPNQMSSDQLTIINALPLYLVDDILTMLLFAAKTRPDLLSSPSMSDVLGMIIFFLRRPNCIQSPHIKAKFSEVLFQVFLPNKERDAGPYNERYINKRYPDGIHASMLDNDVLSQKYLAPALLLLYGDVERTGEYEKINHRRRIMVLLNYLWSVSAHRPAFRGIAQGDADASIATVSDKVITDTSDDVDGAASDANVVAAGDTDGNASGSTYFVRFANGLLNGTNKLVHETLSGLNEIKMIQTVMKSPEWNSMTSEQREEKEEKLHEAEGTVRGNAGLCLETLHMVNYLTSDEIIVAPFLLDEMRPRFVSMLLSILHNITGKKSTDIKVDNSESLHFQPTEMLKEVCQIMLHVAPFEVIYESLVLDAFYFQGETIRKAIATVRKLSLLSKEELEAFVLFESKLVEASETAAFEDIDDDDLGDLADRYQDPLLYTIMTDPVQLPSGYTMDRTTIVQHLLNNNHCPMSRREMTIDDIVPLPELKAEIEAWKTKKLAEKRAAKALNTKQGADTGAEKAS